MFFVILGVKKIAGVKEMTNMMCGYEFYIIKNTEHQYIIDALANLHTLIITQEYLRSDTIF